MSLGANAIVVQGWKQGICGLDVDSIQPMELFERKRKMPCVWSTSYVLFSLSLIKEEQKSLSGYDCKHWTLDICSMNRDTSGKQVSAQDQII